jgi:hypothetical protein
MEESLIPSCSCMTCTTASVHDNSFDLTYANVSRQRLKIAVLPFLVGRACSGACIQISCPTTPILLRIKWKYAKECSRVCQFPILEYIDITLSIFLLSYFPRSVDWDGFSASSTRHLHCAARAWSRWARRACPPQPPLWGREGDVSHPPGAASGRPVVAGGAEGGRFPPSRLPAVRWWCGSPSP